MDRFWIALISMSKFRALIMRSLADKRQAETSAIIRARVQAARHIVQITAFRGNEVDV